MEYPLSRFRCALLEIYCYFFGHNWKTSWRRNGIVVGTPDEDMPYALRQSGNPYWEYSKGWRYKCRRCRRQTRDGAFNPWYKNYYWAIKCSIRSCFSAIKYSREEDGVKSRLWLLPYAILAATTQFFDHMLDDPHWPVFLLDVSLDWEGKTMDKIFKEI